MDFNIALLGYEFGVGGLESFGEDFCMEFELD